MKPTHNEKALSTDQGQCLFSLRDWTERGGLAAEKEEPPMNKLHCKGSDTSLCDQKWGSEFTFR